MILEYLWNLFIYSGDGELISGTGYGGKAECGKGQSAHMELCEAGGSKRSQKIRSKKAGFLIFLNFKFSICKF